jgi:hypothetical protein
VSKIILEKLPNVDYPICTTTFDYAKGFVHNIDMYNVLKIDTYLPRPYNIQDK